AHGGAADDQHSRRGSAGVAGAGDAGGDREAEADVRIAQRRIAASREVPAGKAAADASDRELRSAKRSGAVMENARAEDVNDAALRLAVREAAEDPRDSGGRSARAAWRPGDGAARRQPLGSMGARPHSRRALRRTGVHPGGSPAGQG